jgi:energy-coupling factor transporter transmembrane protein EcfT
VALKLIEQWFFGVLKDYSLVIACLLPGSVHASGILIGICFIGAIFRYINILRSLKTLLPFVAFSTLFFWNQYIVNFITLGYFIGDSTPILDLKQLNYSNYINLTRENSGIFNLC